MGRRKKGIDPNEMEKNRRVPRTFSIPKYIADELGNCKNPSGLVTTILEENVTRIGNLTVGDAVAVREKAVKKMVERAMDDSFESMRPRFIEVVRSALESYKYDVKKDE